jgi:hypothetical protein
MLLELYQLRDVALETTMHPTTGYGLPTGLAYAVMRAPKEGFGMKKQLRTKHSTFCFLLGVSLLVAAVPVTTFAQAEPQIVTVVTVEVNQDMTQEFEELQKELNVALKKAGVTERRMSETVRGPSAEYTIVTPVSKWADYDMTDMITNALGEAGAARWIARVTKCVKNRRVDTMESRPDLSIPLKEGRMPKLAVVTSRRNRPARYGDYNDWLTNKWVPAVKAAGMNGVLVYRNAFGGHSREWVTVSFVDNWATFDGEHPVREHLGDDGWRKLRAGMGEMTSSSVRRIIRLRPDLSILP